MAVTTTPQTGPEASTPGGTEPRRDGSGGLLDPKVLWKSLPDAVKKLDPRVQVRNPVMFVVEVGAAITTYTAIFDDKQPAFNWTIVIFLWLTVVFANLAEAVAEGRGKAQAETLRRTKRETVARRLIGWQPGKADTREEEVPGTQPTPGHHAVVEAGDTIPGDGDVVEGVASVDESAITGESAPVIRESGGDRSAVTGGTRVLSDRIVVKIGQGDKAAATADRGVRLRHDLANSGGRGDRVRVRPGPEHLPQNAAIQVDRVAAARHVSPAAIRALVAQHTQGRTLGFLGEPRVNVLMLNIALDEKYPAGGQG